MARILLTGGSGFVGLNLAESLARRGDDVVLLADRRPDGATGTYLQSLAGNVEITERDVRDVSAVADAARGCDLIIHGAAVTPGRRREAELAGLAVDVNVRGTVSAVTAAADTGVGRLVFLGSAAVYGAGACERVRLLDDKGTPPRPESVYAVTKFAAERIALRMASASGLDLRVVRIGSIFGPWERDTGARDTLSAIYQATTAVMCGDSRVVLPRPGRRDWIYSRDVASAVLRVADADRPPGGIVNIGLGHEWTVLDWCHRLEAVFPGTRFSVAGEGEMATIDYHGDVDRPPLDISRLVDEIGFAPAFDLDMAFADYMRWLREEDPTR